MDNLNFFFCNFSLICGYFLFLVTVTAQIPAAGNCPSVRLVQNLDVYRWFGLWYEICAYPYKPTLGGKCVVTTYASGVTDNQVQVYSRHISLLGTEKKLLGTASLYKDGVLAVMFPAARKLLTILQYNLLHDFILAKANAYYNIIDTDYENYAVIYACNNYYGITNGQNVWILSRRKILEPQFIERAMKALSTNNLSRLYLQHTDQNCV